MGKNGKTVALDKPIFPGLATPPNILHLHPDLHAADFAALTNRTASGIEGSGHGSREPDHPSFRSCPWGFEPGMRCEV